MNFLLKHVSQRAYSQFMHEIEAQFAVLISLLLQFEHTSVAKKANQWPFGHLSTFA